MIRFRIKPHSPAGAISGLLCEQSHCTLPARLPILPNQGLPLLVVQEILHMPGTLRMPPKNVTYPRWWITINHWQAQEIYVIKIMKNHQQISQIRGMIPDLWKYHSTVLQFDLQPCYTTAEAVPANPGGTTFVADVVADGVTLQRGLRHPSHVRHQKSSRIASKKVRNLPLGRDNNREGSV